MRITSAQLRQIIREELERSIDEMDLPFMVGAFSRPTSKKKRGGVARPSRGEKAPRGPIVSQSRAFGGYGDVYGSEEHDAAQAAWMDKDWAGKFANIIVDPYTDPTPSSLGSWISSGSWMTLASDYGDVAGDDDLDAMRTALSEVEIQGRKKLSPAEVDAIMRLWSERESSHMALPYEEYMMLGSGID